jgi:nodulation protein A
VNAVTWSVTWENDMSTAGHEALAVLLGRAFPHNAEQFRGTRTWSGARPEVRVVGSVDGRPIAHLAILRRFLRVPDTDADVLVGDAGLVSVDPDVQGTGIGRALLDRTTRLLTDLALPFGFLTCRPAVVPFYRSGGWQQAQGQVTRMIDDSHQTEVHNGPAMVLPVHATMADWPHGHAVDRNGLEV